MILVQFTFDNSNEDTEQNRKIIIINFMIDLQFDLAYDLLPHNK